MYCGVVVHCGDCGSSNSDITEPCSPLSTTSLEEMPPTQSQPAWLWGADAGDPPSKRPKQGKITEYFKTKSKKGSDKPHSVKQLISKLLSSPPSTPKPSILSYEETDVFRDSLTPSIDSSIIPPTPPATSPESSSDASILSKSEPECDGISFLFYKADKSDHENDRESEEKQERTIRFPVKPVEWTRPETAGHILCQWAGCDEKFTTTTTLSEHLQNEHVNSQTMDENYMCRWLGCKVFGRQSCSRTWLERHVISHGGNKPFRCIVEGCGQRFSSQNVLERHVNNHFNDGKDPGGSKKGCDSSKHIRRNGKKLRIRSHPFSARIYDFFDAGIMEGLQHNLIEITEKRTQGLYDTSPGDTVTFHSKVLGKRIDDSGHTKVLLRWYPRQILTDEWVDESKIERTRHVNMASLSTQSKDCLYNYLTSNQRLRRTIGRKRKTHLLCDDST